ncbi:MAG: glycosyltransferase family 4 protein [Patescibacteria group bacterium]
MERKPRVLYLYAGSRKHFYEEWKKGLVADTQLLGQNHMSDLGIDAEFKEFQISELLRKINFNLVHLPYLSILRRYDVVFICAGLPLVFAAKKIFGWKKPRFVIYNTSLTNALLRNKRGFARHILVRAISALDSIVCTATEQADFLKKEGFDPEKIVVRPIGIDPAPFLAHDDTYPDIDTPFIVSVGRDLGRDYATLFEAVRELPIKVVVATKPEAVLGLTPPPNVEIRFNVPYSEMPKLYRKALFAVTPLRDATNPNGSDTSGQYGFLEPMAAGRAVIVSDRSTVHDYLEHEKSALLVPPGNPTALRGAIEELIRDSAKRDRLALAGREAVRERYTSTQFARELARIFQRLADTRV